MIQEAILHSEREAHQQLRKRDDQSPWAAVQILLSVLWPTVVFVYEFAICGYGIRFYAPWWCLILGPILGGCLCVATVGRTQRLIYHEQATRATVMRCFGVCLAVILASVAGTDNFYDYMSDYYNYKDLAIYANIDPSIDKGQTYMDAGQVYFKEQTNLDTNHAAVYQNDGLFCVAPILGQTIENQGGKTKVQSSGPTVVPISGTFDFWAVGKNCCLPPHGAGFKCGDAGKKSARAGMRLLKDDERPLYQLAVHSWAEKNKLPVRHPLFFEWVDDPLAKMDLMLYQSVRRFCLCAANFVVVQLGFSLFGLYLMWYRKWL